MKLVKFLGLLFIFTVQSIYCSVKLHKINRDLNLKKSCEINDLCIPKINEIVQDLTKEEQKCTEVMLLIMQYEDKILKKFFTKKDVSSVQLYKKKYFQNKILLELHKSLQEYYLKTLKSLLTKKNPNVLNFLANYAYDELLDAIQL